MINPIDPLGTAARRTGTTLFQPFEPLKWLTMGFSSWLAGFLSGQSTSFTVGDLRETSSQDWGFASDLVSLGQTTWMIILAAIFLILGLFALLFFWIGARGRFVFLSNLVTNCGEVVRPWKEFRSQANSLFRAHAAVFLVNWLLLLVLVCGALVTVWPDLEKWSFRPAGEYVSLLIIFMALMAVWFASAVVLFFLREFGVPWMYRTGGSAVEALRILGQVAGARPVDMILYFACRLMLEVVLFCTAVAIGCATCCAGFLPYIGAVLTLPLAVFRLGYVLDCVRQFGKAFDVWAVGEATTLEGL